eukprot:127551_1
MAAHLLDEGAYDNGSNKIIDTSLVQWLTKNNLQHLVSKFEKENMTLDELIEFSTDETSFQQYLEALQIPKPSILRICFKIKKQRNDGDDRQLVIQLEQNYKQIASSSYIGVCCNCCNCEQNQQYFILPLYGFFGGGLAFICAAMCFFILISSVSIALAPCALKTIIVKSWKMVMCCTNPLNAQYRSNTNCNAWWIWMIFFPITTFVALWHIVFAVFVGVISLGVMYPICVIHFNLAKIWFIPWFYEIKIIKENDNDT